MHYNDFHARFEETSPAGNMCNPDHLPCIGGFARLATAVRNGFKKEPDSLLLNGGDSFQGTIWYNMLRWNVTQEFMNMLPHDAHVLGNHEFDNGIEGVVPYLEYLNSTVVAANIDDTDEPKMHGLYKNSTIITRGGRKIGIIGVIISITNTLATTGNLRFKDEVETVKAEAEKLNAEGVNIIIVLSHCGIDIDREIALHAGPYIDIIVGGHSHTLLFNGEVPENTAFVPLGPYPVVVNRSSTQKPVLIVQAGAHTAYLGEIKLFFDFAGNLLDWTGNPHFLGNDIEQAPDVLERIEYYLPLIQELASEVIGVSMVDMSNDCSCSECNLGNFICDAYMHSVLHRAQNNSWHSAHFCVVNRGGIRSPITHGVVNFGSVMLSTPFENRIEVFDLKGKHVLEMLEYSVANIPSAGARMLQTSGLHATFDGSLPVNQRVLDVRVRCIECDVPRYEPLDLDKYYRVVAQSFIGSGGDGFTNAMYEPLLLDKYYRVVTTDFIGNGGGEFTMISENRINVDVTGVDYEVLMDYIRHQTPVFAQTEGRVQISNPCLV
ncbi:unnamed protein product [Arctia plantaginis]|uniref:apyrase n=1 Tax=Arctia plantaginis TaxID=874455 RepID=A0A8S0ZV94_ARCPL|nr:unnamed protein product [Arctia plantaginis]